MGREGMRMTREGEGQDDEDGEMRMDDGERGLGRR